MDRFDFAFDFDFDFDFDLDYESMFGGCAGVVPGSISKGNEMNRL